jgi:hypothetical protein
MTKLSSIHVLKVLIDREARYQDRFCKGITPSKAECERELRREGLLFRPDDETPMDLTDRAHAFCEALVNTPLPVRKYKKVSYSSTVWVTPKG